MAYIAALPPPRQPENAPTVSPIHPAPVAAVATVSPPTPPERLAGLVQALAADFAQHGHIHEAMAPGVPETLFIVPTLRAAGRLAGEGIARGRVWTAAELAEMVTICASPEDFAAIALVKLAVGGELVATRRTRP